MTQIGKGVKRPVLDKVVDFGRQLFAATLRSRKGALSEFARLLRFQKGTKGFEREYNRLVPLHQEIREAYKQSVLSTLPNDGLRLGILDDSPVKKTGKYFPEQSIQHDHTTGAFFSGMRVLSSCVYQNGKVATVSSRLVDKNKLELANEDIDLMLNDYFVDLFLFDSWYCKQPVIKHIEQCEKLFISRLRCDTKTLFCEDEARLDALLKSLPHQSYEHIKINKKSYWICDFVLDLKAHGTMRVIASKEGQHEEPIFLVTNAYQFSATFIVKLYLRRFSIEVFFKDAKQFLNFETFFCRNKQKWEIHLLLTNVLHWAMQRKKSISKTVRNIRENIDQCLLFINENSHIQIFEEELGKLCPT